MDHASVPARDIVLIDPLPANVGPELSCLHVSAAGLSTSAEWIKAQ